MNNNIDKIYELVNGIDYSRDIPKEAELLAKNNNIIIIVGGSDDLMYCYGAESYLTRRCEHGYGWDGSLLQNIHDKNLECEAKQLGLEIYWCGKILDKYVLIFILIIHLFIIIIINYILFVIFSVKLFNVSLKDSSKIPLFFISFLRIF